MYVDDLLKSLDTIEEIRTLYRESIQLFADSEFHLTKWATNTVDVYADILEEECAPVPILLREHIIHDRQRAMGPR